MRSIRGEQGQSLTEFALLVPLLLLLVCGIVDFGRVMYGYMHLNMAAQETVRLGGLGKTDAEITAFARGYVHLGDPAKLKITISPTQATRTSGQYVKVTLEYPVGFATPFLSRVLPAPVVTADSTIRVE
ncbi:TadE/TadG family type IV pilus assembly protein [Gorillibacterium sp. sgz5001074]|uniref:TadE/TadG family type IV pilus assembly protein n=1 Tax=Gorillibacterium sp. sgz5001074 TaxID=3446695 RepID=UPI003F67D3E4